MRTIYYSDELNDDFSGAEIKTKDMPSDYKYFSKNIFRIIFDFVMYYIIAMPVSFLYQKILYSEKYINRKALKDYRKDGYFLFANHTRMGGDGFMPSNITFPKKAYIISNPDCISVPVVGHITTALGCVPLPTSIKGMRNFHSAIKEHSKKGHVIMVYPEAHIWPYYTKIRPFKDSSFRYASELKKPVFCATVTYRKRKFIKRPKTVVYIDGPFLPKEEYNLKENQAYLHSLVIEKMRERSENSNIEYVKYEKKEKSE